VFSHTGGIRCSNRHSRDDPTLMQTRLSENEAIRVDTHPVIAQTVVDLGLALRALHTYADLRLAEADTATLDKAMPCCVGRKELCDMIIDAATSARSRTVLRLAVIALAYYGSHQLGNLFLDPVQHISTVWPANGLTLVQSASGQPSLRCSAA
jgi:hypothetical protein